MNWVHLVIGLVLLQFFFFCMAVGRARGTYNVAAPATTGNEVFERYFRVQMNTLELLVVLIPVAAAVRTATSAPAGPRAWARSTSSAASSTSAPT